MDRSEIVELARSHGFGAFAESLAEVAVWGMRIGLATAPEVTGRSRLGGRPDLSPSTPWPAGPAGEPMVFVAQIRLEDVASIDWGGPADGLLSFFMTLEADGFPLWAPGAAAVLHAPSEGAVPRDPPAGAVVPEAAEACAAMAFTPELCLPSTAVGPDLVLEAIGLDLDASDQTMQYIALCNDLAERQGIPSPRSDGIPAWAADRFCGHPASHQSDPIADCLVLTGASDAQPWRHLLQLTGLYDDDLAETGSYFCAPVDEHGRWRFADAQATHQHA